MASSGGGLGGEQGMGTACTSHGHTSGRDRRRRGNQAWRAIEQWCSAINSGDGAAAMNQLSARYEIERHDLHVVLDREGFDDYATLFSATTRMDAEHIVSLGQRHCMYRFDVEWTSVDGGLATADGIGVTQVDGEGRLAREGLFLGLGPAVERMLQWWGMTECAFPPPIASSRLFGSTTMLNEGRWPDFEACYADDAVTVDHRGPMGEVDGAAAIADRTKRWRESVDTAKFDLVDVLALAPNASISVSRITGTAGGAPYEVVPVTVAVFGSDGRAVRQELFRLEDVDHAWSVFDAFADRHRSDR